MMALGAMVIGCERHDFEGEHGTRQLHDRSVAPSVDDMDQDEADSDTDS